MDLAALLRRTQALRTFVREARRGRAVRRPGRRARGPVSRPCRHCPCPGRALVLPLAALATRHVCVCVARHGGAGVLEGRRERPLLRLPPLHVGSGCLLGPALHRPVRMQAA